MSGSNPVPELDREHFDAALFDLDGVLTDTARVHAAAWKRLFDDFLRERAERRGEDMQGAETRGRSGADSAPASRCWPASRWWRAGSTCAPGTTTAAPS